MSEENLKTLKKQIDSHIEKAEEQMNKGERPVIEYKVDKQAKLYPFCISSSIKTPEQLRNNYNLEYLGSGCDDCDQRKKDKKEIYEKIVRKLNFAYSKVCITGTYEGFRELIREYEALYNEM